MLGRLTVFGLLFALWLAPLSGAGDPDDDWGLPAVSSNDAGDLGAGSENGSASSQQAAPSNLSAGAPDASALIAPVATHLESALTLELGQLVISAPQQVAEGSAAAVEPVLDAAPVTAPTFVGSEPAVAVQGAALVEFGPSLGLRLHAPAFASFHVAYLMLDDGEVADLGSMLQTAAGRAHVSSVQALGAMTSLDVARFQKLVTSQAGALGEQRVSVVILSGTSHGGVHVSAVRLSPSGSDIELLTH
ncbi:MAG: hypothetical protein DHS20C15_16150 [Planctomycetota bacterium]|nr:MAG: hypothetical protein DHS20C15_16150 [Planctomycetota bacterium]